MFYEKLINLCKENNVKPTPTLKSLGISPGNLKRWETGAAVNSDTLEKIANHFNVPIDFFFIGDNDKFDIIEDNNSPKKIYGILRTHPDYIASSLVGNEISSGELKTIADYMNCSADYLLNGSEVKLADLTNKPAEAFIAPDTLVIEVLTRLAGNKTYKAVQVNISRIIINNLAKMNISRDKLYEIKLSSRKISDLYDREASFDSIVGLNCSDLIRISRAFSVSYSFMFTGRE